MSQLLHRSSNIVQRKSLNTPENSQFFKKRECYKYVENPR